MMQAMICGKCGKPNSETARFCASCGAGLARQSVPPADTLDRGQTQGEPQSHPAAPRQPHSPTPYDTLDSARTMAHGEIHAGMVLAGRYEILERLGSGGMGEVWKAEDAELGMSVALKLLPTVLARNEGSIEALRREAAISLRLTHPNICRIHSLHTDGHLKFLVMEYVEGKTLEAMLEGLPGRRMRWETLRPIAEQVAAALDHAHSLQPPVLHRDVKPTNIMVTPAGHAKVLDFGIAREMKDSMTRMTGKQTSGTLLYMSPEQFSGRDPSPSSDTYSLAATLYECLCGRPPFYQGSIEHQLMNMPPLPITGLAEAVNEGLIAGLAKEPADRPPTGRELVQWMSGEKPMVAAPVTESQEPLAPSPPSAPMPPSLPAQPAAPKKKRRGLVAAVLVIVLLLVGAAGVGVIGVEEGWWIAIFGPPTPTQAPSRGPVSPEPTPVEPQPMVRPEVLVAIKVEAEMAIEKVGRLDRGQGLGTAVETAEKTLHTAEARYIGKAYAQSKSLYEQVIDLCRSIELLDGGRRSALAARSEADAAARAAGTAASDPVAKAQWDGAFKLAEDARVAFETGKFTEAEVSWRAAKDDFDRARASAERSGKGREAALAAKNDAAKSAEDARKGGAAADASAIWGQAEKGAKDAAAAFEAGRYAEAESAWRAAREQYGRAVVEADLVGKVRRSATAAKAAAATAEEAARAAGAESDAASFWQAGRTASDQAEASFRGGNFTNAESAWGRARDEFAKAEARGRQVGAAKRARAEYERAIADCDMARLLQYGGSAWQAVQSRVSAAMNETDPVRQASLYQEAAQALPAAVRAANQTAQAAATPPPTPPKPPPVLTPTSQRQASTAGGRPSTQHPNVYEMPNGKVQPAPGYKWVTPTEGDFRVVWTPGTPHSDWPHVVAAPQENNWRAAPGYKWVTPEPGDYRVYWVPGLRHADYANVVAGEQEGKWQPAAGYKWLNDVPGDLRVVPAN